MTSKSSVPPILPETFEAMVEPWLSGIAKKDIVAVMSYPASDRQRRVLQLLGDSKTQKKFLLNPEKFLWITLDFRVDPIDDVSDLEMHIQKKLIEQTGIKIPERIPFNEVIARVEKRTRQKLILYCFGCEQLLRKRAVPILIWFTVQCRVDSLRMLLFFEANLFSLKTLELFGSVPAFQPRIANLTLYDVADARLFIHHMTQSEWHFDIDSTIANRIISECGGVFLLIKEALWYLRDHSHATTDSIFSHTEMQFNLATLWHGFEKDEQEVLERVVKRETLDDPKYDASVMYLERMRLLSHERTGWRLTVPLFARYLVKRFTQHKQLILNDRKEILLDGVPVGAHFSRSQKRILQTLILKSPDVVTRQEISLAIWPSNTLERYSDWAIDSHMSRLRTKLIQLGMGAHVIETKKDKGFIFRIPV